MLGDHTKLIEREWFHLKNTARTVLSLLTVLFMASGCGKSDTPAEVKVTTTAISTSTTTSTPAAEIKMDPVTIKFAATNAMFSAENFKLYVSDPVSKKYPFITVERINTSDKGSSVTDLLAAGITPDIVGYYPGTIGQLNELKLTNNIEELIKKYKFDVNRISPEVLDTIKVASNQNYLVGLPTYNTLFALFYNKDLFDKFGVSYPKDGMTWDQLNELGVKLTRVDSGVQYRGLYADYLYRGARQLGLSAVDFTTNKSVLSSDPWKQLFQYWSNLYSAPGLMEGNYKNIATNINTSSFAAGELAMIADQAATATKVTKMNWDLVTYPTNPKAPGVGQRVDGPVLNITAQSKNKDAAFLVLETILSDEVQKNMSQNLVASVLKDQKIKDAYGTGISGTQG